jgi:hypothetical protein
MAGWTNEGNTYGAVDILLMGKWAVGFTFTYLPTLINIFLYSLATPDSGVVESSNTVEKKNIVFSFFKCMLCMYIALNFYLQYTSRDYSASKSTPCIQCIVEKKRLSDTLATVVVRSTPEYLVTTSSLHASDTHFIHKIYFGGLTWILWTTVYSGVLNNNLYSSTTPASALLVLRSRPSTIMPSGTLRVLPLHIHTGTHLLIVMPEERKEKTEGCLINNAQQSIDRWIKIRRTQETGSLLPLSSCLFLVC